MRTKLTTEQQAAIKAAHQAQVAERREARKAETKARNEAKKAAALADLQAHRAAQQQAYIAAQQKKRDDFKASLSEQDWADLQEALSEETTRTDSTGHVTMVTNDWLHSVKGQFQASGFLSPRQLEPLLRRVRQRREQAEKAKEWKEVQEGDLVKMWCTIRDVQRVQDAYGTTFKIRVFSHYGRAFSFKTGREDWVKTAEDKKLEGKKVMVVGKVKWVAPDAGGPVVLTSRGMKFGDLL